MNPLSFLNQSASIVTRRVFAPQRPLLASYKLTYQCNLVCRQCAFHNLPGAQPTFMQARATLDRLYARGNRLVVFEGGEPLLWRDGSRTIHDLISYAQKRFYCTGITTNGTLPLDTPADILWVSLDGFRETHNTLRGADIYDRVIAHIHASPHPKLFAHITVNRVNAAEVPDLIRFLSGLVKGITVQFYYPYTPDDDLFLEFDQRDRLLTEIIALKCGGYPVRNSTAALQALRRNTWRCASWLIDSANPDGSINQGCYLTGRASIDCARCGFSPYTELSLAYQGRLPAIRAGIGIFF